MQESMRLLDALIFMAIANFTMCSVTAVRSIQLHAEFCLTSFPRKPVNSTSLHAHLASLGTSRQQLVQPCSKSSKMKMYWQLNRVILDLYSKQKMTKKKINKKQKSLLSRIKKLKKERLDIFNQKLLTKLPKVSSMDCKHFLTSPKCTLKPKTKSRAISTNFWILKKLIKKIKHQVLNLTLKAIKSISKPKSTPFWANNSLNKLLHSCLLKKKMLIFTLLTTRLLHNIVPTKP